MAIYVQRQASECAVIRVKPSLFAVARWMILATLGGLLPITLAQEANPSSHHHHHHNMTLDRDGMVMNSNRKTLPRDCKEIGPDVEFTVYAGTEYAGDNPGTTFGFSQHEFEVEPCSRVTVTFINKDQIRHQWMVHGLPKYLYPTGMFHLEAAGGKQQIGTFIVPSDKKTYLVHCDVAQHMEKGMKGQLKVAGGDGDLWGIPGVSGDFNVDSYLSNTLIWYIVIGAMVSFLVLFLLIRNRM